MTHRTMSEHSYHGATSRPLVNLFMKILNFTYMIYENNLILTHNSFKIYS